MGSWQLLLVLVLLARAKRTKAGVELWGSVDLRAFHTITYFNSGIYPEVFDVLVQEPPRVSSRPNLVAWPTEVVK